MKIAVLGTGMVGRALAGRLSGLGHDVVIGTRDVEQTLTHRGTGAMGTPPYADWQETNPAVRLMALPEAAGHGEVILNATNGQNSLAALQAAGRRTSPGRSCWTWPCRWTSPRACRPPSLSPTRTASANRSSALFPTHGS